MDIGVALRPRALRLRGVVVVMALIAAAVSGFTAIPASAAPADWTPYYQNVYNPNVPYQGGTNWQAVSCGDATHCWAVGGNAMAFFNGTSWIGQTTSPYYLSSVSCADATHCLAATGTNVVLQYAGGGWQAATLPSTGPYPPSIQGVSCPDVSHCWAIGTRNGPGPSETNTYFFDGLNWTAQFSPLSGTVNDLSCATAQLCVAVSGSGSANVWNGQAWAPASYSGAAFLASISCPDATGCVAIGGAPSPNGSTASALRYNAASNTWTPLASLPPGIGASRLACTSATKCLAVNVNGAARFEAGSWSLDQPPSNGPVPSLTNVGCSTAECWVTGSGVVYKYTGIGGLPAIGGSGSVSWINRTPLTSPTARAGHGMVYDSYRHQTVVFGGWGFPGAGSSYLNDTWLWNGASWMQVPSQVAPAGPSPRQFFAFAYDMTRHVSVLFGGQDYLGQKDAATWEWDGTAWRQRFPISSPPGRSAASMAFDSARGRMVLFGGTGNSGDMNDTWEFDSAGNTWVLRSNSGPAPRDAAAMAFDASRNRTVLFGGTGQPNYQNDTWEWDGTQWHPVTSATAGAPAPRIGGTMTYDAVGHRVVLFGGGGQPVQTPTYQPGAALNDVESFDGVQWSRYSAGAGPLGRAFAGFAADTDRGVLVLFGGNPGSVATSMDGDTWEAALGSGGPSGPPPSAISITPGSFNFPATNVNPYGPSQAFQVRNTGSAPVQVFGVSSSSPDFRLDFYSSTCQNITIYPGGYCIASVSFTPQSAGLKSGTLTISDSLGQQTAALSGLGVNPPQASLSAGYMDLGSAPVGSSTPSQALTVTNTGGADLHINSVGTGGNGTGDIPSLASNTCYNATLVPGANCSMMVSATPLALGQRSGTIFINDNAPGGNQQVSVVANGTDPGPVNGWAMLNPGSLRATQRITCADDTHCMVAGNGITSTSDGGNTWSQAYPASIYGGGTFFDIACPTASNCWAVNGSNQVITTSDAGATWTWQSTSLQYVYSISCPDQLTCYAGGMDISLGQNLTMTKDGGQTWTTPALASGIIFALACPDTQHCVASAGNDILTTADGGATWTSTSPAGFHSLDSLSCPTYLVCYAPQQGLVIKTSDGGATWSQVFAAPQAGSFAVSCSSATVCVYTRVNSASTTTDGGNTWSTVSVGNVGGIATVACTQDSVCYAVGSFGAILKHGGRTVSQPMPASGGTVSSGSGTSADQPSQAAVTTPPGGNAGTVAITVLSQPNTALPTGYTFAGQQIHIDAPAQSAANPLALDFYLDASAVPSGETYQSIQMFKNGIAVTDCTGPTGQAAPNPCTAVREPGSTPGSIHLQVLTSDASNWNFGAAGALDHLGLSPAATTVPANQDVAYTATGYDSYGHSRGPVAPTFTITPEVGGTGTMAGASCAGTVCRATHAGTYTVKGDAGGPSGTAVLTVTPGPLHHLSISPSSAGVASGAPALFTATGYDVYGNTLGYVTAATNFTVSPSGPTTHATCVLNACSASRGGTYVVTGTDGIATGTAALSVQSRVLFARTSADGSSRIYVMNPDGSGLTPLTGPGYLDSSPTWSADATKVAFSSNRGGHSHIYVVGAGGGAVTALTSGKFDDSSPAWSPDGTRIAFATNRGGSSHIYVMIADENALAVPATLTPLTSGASADGTPAWSPDGTRVAFTSLRSGHVHIYTTPAAGGTATAITTGLFDDATPAWSPNGASLVYTSVRNGHAHLYRVSATPGAIPAQLTAGAVDDFLPAWSTDGSQVAFASTRAGGTHLYMLDAVTQVVTRLTTGTSIADLSPAWRAP